MAYEFGRDRITDGPVREMSGEFLISNGRSVSVEGISSETIGQGAVPMRTFTIRVHRNGSCQERLEVGVLDFFQLARSFQKGEGTSEARARGDILRMELDGNRMVRTRLTFEGEAEDEPEDEQIALTVDETNRLVGEIKSYLMEERQRTAKNQTGDGVAYEGNQMPPTG